MNTVLNTAEILKNISVDAVVVQLDSLFHITAQSWLGETPAPHDPELDKWLRKGWMNGKLGNSKRPMPTAEKNEAIISALDMKDQGIRSIKLFVQSKKKVLCEW